ncbi:MAG TPA: hypothetical protein VGQ36_06875 [Thermoanaerobaculia bacterium]|jgi:hypothetical protein|nr:hypothetical protein [Thermoanaerobaculia bacterium]
MDHAVALVQAYLQLNGYFTSAEYPIIAGAGRGFRTITDIDILAFRFPSGEPMAKKTRKAPKGLDVSGLDSGLGVPVDSIDMIIGEVKEGRVNMNTGIRDPEVLNTVINRFGQVGDPNRVVQQLLRTGTAEIPPAYSVRLIAFGSFPPGAPVPPCRIVSLGHVLQFLQSYVRKHWTMLRHLQFKDPAFGFLMTMEKARRGGAGRRGQQGVEIVPPDEQPRRDDRRK